MHGCRVVGRVCGLAANFERVRAHLVFLAGCQRLSDSAQSQSSTAAEAGHGMSGCRVSGVLGGSFVFPSASLSLDASLTTPPQEHPARPLFLTHPRFPSAIETPVRGCCPPPFGLAELFVRVRASTSAHLSPLLLPAEPRLTFTSTRLAPPAEAPVRYSPLIAIRREHSTFYILSIVRPTVQFDRPATLLSCTAAWDTRNCASHPPTPSSSARLSCSLPVACAD